MKKVGWTLLLTIFLTLFLLVSLAPGRDWGTKRTIVKLGRDIEIREGEVVEGDVVAIAGNVIVSGEVGGNVVALGGDIDLRPTAKVDGGVVCLVGRIRRDLGAQIGGDVVEIFHPRFPTRIFRVFPFPLGLYLWGVLVKFIISIIMLVIALLSVAFFPKQAEVVMEHFKGDYFKDGLVGLLTLIVALPLMVLVALTIVGIPLAFLLFLFLIAAGCFGIASIGLWLGRRIRKDASLLGATLIGMLILMVISFIPFLGLALVYLGALVGLGAVLLTKFGTGRPWVKVV